jgi:glycosyltransferase involved in cell wall biosynthesis
MGCNMLKVDLARRDDSDRGPVVISVMRDEAARLPHWLTHYRSMGVSSFLVVNNGSTDGTAACLAAQPDVTTLNTDESFAAANFGMHWVNAIRAQLGDTTWSLFADADEYLIYDGWPERPLSAYTSALNADVNAIWGFMLDAYPKDDLAGADPASDLLQTSPFFDAKYHFRRRPMKPWEKSDPSLEVLGGPRVRLLSTFDREVGTTWVDYFFRGQLDRLLNLAQGPLASWIIEHFPASMPALKKTPMLRGSAVSYINNHDVAGAVYHQRNCVHLHFKFAGDFFAKMQSAELRKEHYRQGAEYILYARAIAQRGQSSIYSDQDSRRFVSANTLVEAGLIRDIHDLL